MNFIKLDAIDSTNDFLKKMSSGSDLENFTVVTAKSQTNGKGQRGAKWSSEHDKNLIASVLIKENAFDSKTIFNLNIVVSLAVFHALKKENIPDLYIKWPNDILANNKKIGGILIENSFKSDGTITSVVGIGININQTNFEAIPNASSLALILNKICDKDLILNNITENLKQYLSTISNNRLAILWKEYKQFLFKFEKPCAFEDTQNKQFMGKIIDINSDGKICVVDEKEESKWYNIKEIKMLY